MISPKVSLILALLAIGIQGLEKPRHPTCSLVSLGSSKPAYYTKRIDNLGESADLAKAMKRLFDTSVPSSKHFWPKYFKNTRKTSVKKVKHTVEVVYGEGQDTVFTDLLEGKDDENCALLTGRTLAEDKWYDFEAVLELTKLDGQEQSLVMSVVMQNCGASKGNDASAPEVAHNCESHVEYGGFYLVEILACLVRVNPESCLRQRTLTS